MLYNVAGGETVLQPIINLVSGAFKNKTTAISAAAKIYIYSYIRFGVKEFCILGSK